jgi:hypothetical protein
MSEEDMLQQDTMHEIEPGEEGTERPRTSYAPSEKQQYFRRSSTMDQERSVRKSATLHSAKFSDREIAYETHKQTKSAEEE